MSHLMKTSPYSWFAGVAIMLAAILLFLPTESVAGSSALAGGDCVVGPGSIGDGYCCNCIPGDPEVFGQCYKSSGGGLHQACEWGDVIWCHPNPCVVFE
jgi:hypothetical protein